MTPVEDTTVPRITLAMLKGACKGQRATFRKEWPKGAAVTVENVLRAADLGLDLEWGAIHWFSATARKAYQEANATAWKAYREATATAWKAYQEATATAWVAAFVASRRVALGVLVTSCGACGADIGPSRSFVWHHVYEDCRAIREPLES